MGRRNTNKKLEPNGNDCPLAGFESRDTGKRDQVGTCLLGQKKRGRQAFLQAQAHHS